MSTHPHQSLIDRLHTPISVITAYDYPSARLCDEAGIQMILVGDSLGMVVAGCPDTTSVTIEQMIYHTQIVRRGINQAVLVSDLPIHTYDTPEAALENGRRLIEAGADAVKLEGGIEQVEKIRTLTEANIPFCGHLGMLPQSVREEGGYRKKGKTLMEADRLIASAQALEAAGAFAIVLESVVSDVARKITESVRIPTIGIGSGVHCDGQVRVLHDVIGAFPWFVPPFATIHGDVSSAIRTALDGYLSEIAVMEEKRMNS